MVGNEEVKNEISAPVDWELEKKGKNEKFSLIENKKMGERKKKSKLFWYIVSRELVLPLLSDQWFLIAIIKVYAYHMWDCSCVRLFSWHERFDVIILGTSKVLYRSSVHYWFTMTKCDWTYTQLNNIVVGVIKLERADNNHHIHLWFRLGSYRMCEWSTVWFYLVCWKIQCIFNSWPHWVYYIKIHIWSIISSTKRARSVHSKSPNSI